MVAGAAGPALAATSASTATATATVTPASSRPPQKNTSSAGYPLHFDFFRDTLAFPNWTVWNYENGRHVIGETRDHRQKTDRYTRRCFVMSRTAEQFLKFARFDRQAAPLDDRELAHRVRAVTRRAPWHDPLPPDKRIVFPGYANLRELSKARKEVLQSNIGLGWPTYLRIGNFRMVYIRGPAYQEKTHRLLNDALDRGEMFVAYLSDFPILHINHSVLIYKKLPNRGNIENYLCYDPNHAEAPRRLSWLPDKRQFNYQQDQEFKGGYVRVYQIYGKALQ